MKIPLAWLQLTREKMRLLVALAGIGFADILMFMQLGFRDALFDSSVRIHENLDGDIFLVSPQSTTLTAMKSFPQRRLYQTLAFEGVESVKPVYLDLSLWKNPVDRSTRSIFVLAFNPDDTVFNLPGVVNNINQIKLPDRVLFDAASREEFGPVAEKFTQGEPVITEVGGRRVEVKGLFEMGASFGANGNIFTSDLNFLRIFPRRQKGIIDIGIVKLKPTADVEAVLKGMKTYLPDDVIYFSKQEFIDWEKNYWATSTTIGFIFTLGTAMGFIVGIVIVYQILYTDVSDHLAEYATLKAMGYKDLYFLIVVFQEALILAILGYFPACAVAIGLYNLTRNATSLPLIMTLARATTVLILTVVMCSVSGVIAVRKLSAADPADIF
ncbi:MAG: ABC transporter permease DevC [Microcoleus vaginatus WJT46-NPBG5]|jgi:putative ABC transport system permease protein|nr:ABC transporter permease DevC [Microcoleus vaginatus WJT46-NPBG5]